MPSEADYKREIARLKDRVAVLEREKQELLEESHERLSMSVLRFQLRELEARVQEEGKRITGLRIDTKTAIDHANELHREHKANIASHARIIDELRIKLQVLEESHEQAQTP